MDGNDGDNANRDNLLPFLLAFGILCLFACFRQLHGGNIDEYAYRNKWLHYSRIGLGEALALSKEKELLFVLLCWLSSHLFETSQGIIISTSFVTLGGFLWGFRRYSLDFQYAVLLFISMGLLWNSFNGIQQYTAAAVLFIFADRFSERKLKSILLVTLLCMSIHQSAIFFLYFYWMSKYKTNSHGNIIFIILVTALLMFVAYRCVSFAGRYLYSLEQYANYNEIERNGVRFITILISFVPVSLLVLFKEKIASSDSMTRFSSCLCCVDAGIMLASSMDTYIARFTIYTTPFVILYMSRSRQFFNNAQSNYTLYKIASITLYSAVLFLRMRGTLYTWGSQYGSF